jgi:hypothetical protein
VLIEQRKKWQVRLQRANRKIRLIPLLRGRQRESPLTSPKSKRDTIPQLVQERETDRGTAIVKTDLETEIEKEGVGTGHVTEREDDKSVIDPDVLLSAALPKEGKEVGVVIAKDGDHRGGEALLPRRPLPHRARHLLLVLEAELQREERGDRRLC